MVGKNFDLIPIENLWTVVKNKVADKQASSARDWTRVMKQV